MAMWSTADVNDLPDSSFGWIAPGGEKDKGGKTVPRALRHLPYKDKSGKVDAAHTRNALARLDGVRGMSASAKDRVREKLESALGSVDKSVRGRDVMREPIAKCLETKSVETNNPHVPTRTMYPEEDAPRAEDYPPYETLFQYLAKDIGDWKDPADKRIAGMLAGLRRENALYFKFSERKTGDVSEKAFARSRAIRRIHNAVQELQDIVEGGDLDSNVTRHVWWVSSVEGLLDKAYSVSPGTRNREELVSRLKDMYKPIEATKAEVAIGTPVPIG